MDLATLSTPQRVGADRFTITMPNGWLLGRGVFGGLVFGAMVRALEDHEGDTARKLRSLTLEIFAPVEQGVSAEIIVTRLRQGNNISAVRAELRQGGEVRAHAVGLLASRRKVKDVSWQELTTPQSPAWRDLEPGTMEPPLAPEFVANFKFRVVTGLPGSGGNEVIGWVEPVVPSAVQDAGYIAAMIDTFWPLAMVRLPAPRPLATIAFTLDIVGDLEGLDAAAPLLYRAASPVCRDGYFVETRELWGEDGRLIALNHQTFAIIA